MKRSVQIVLRNRFNVITFQIFVDCLTLWQRKQSQHTDRQRALECHHQVLHLLKLCDKWEKFFTLSLKDMLAMYLNTIPLRADYINVFNWRWLYQFVTLGLYVDSIFQLLLLGCAEPSRCGSAVYVQQKSKPCFKLKSPQTSNRLDSGKLSQHYCFSVDCRKYCKPFLVFSIFPISILWNSSCDHPWP